MQCTLIMVAQIQDTAQHPCFTHGAQKVRCKCASVAEALALTNGQQSRPCAALLLFLNRKPIEAQSAGLFQPCKWISLTPPWFVKWGLMGLLLFFFSASLSPHSTVMSTVK